MLSYKAYKFRIYPNKEQKVLFAKTFGCVRLVYNYYLNCKIQGYEIDKTTLSYVDCSKDLVPLKKEKIKQHRTAPKEYRLKSAAISKTPTDKYFVSILYEYETEINRIEPVTSIGLDFSMSELFVASEGQPVNYPRYYRQSLEKLAGQQRILSRKKKAVMVIISKSLKSQKYTRKL